jgi:hypothetical protein
MNISFGRIVYINNTMNDLAPSIPKFKMVIYTDKFIDKTYVILYTYNNKYVKEFEFNYFEKMFQKISNVLTLPFDPSTDLYYGDDLFIELNYENGKKIKWLNVRPDPKDPGSCYTHQKAVARIINKCCHQYPTIPGMTNNCHMYQSLVKGTTDDCSPEPIGECIIGSSNIKLTRSNQIQYETATKTVFTVMIELFKSKIPEYFYKKY